jgi:hypothetical protein
MRRVHPHLLLSASVLSVAAMAWASSAGAQGWGSNGYLQGVYGFTGSTGCLYAPGSASSPPAPGNTTPEPNAGFNSSLQPIDHETSFSNSTSIEGYRIFNGDGTGTVKATETGMTPPPTPGPTGYPSFPPSAESANISYSFTYVVNPDGSWTSQMVPGSFSGTFVTGPRTGQTFTTTIPEFSGLSGHHARVLTAANLTPTPEIQIFSNGDVFPRICHRSRVYIQLDDQFPGNQGQGGQGYQGGQGFPGGQWWQWGQ